jgi:hypothetical protein
MRWVLLIPLGIYELVLLALTVVMLFIHKGVAGKLYCHAQKLPDKDWYFNKTKPGAEKL